MEPWTVVDADSRYIDEEHDPDPPWSEKSDLHCIRIKVKTGIGIHMKVMRGRTPCFFYSISSKFA
jgi:hypothetical protein